jgi:hypothetical protein
MLNPKLVHSLSENGWLKINHGAKEILTLAHWLGNPIPSRRKTGILDRLRPVEKEHAKSWSLSETYGLDKFPFHSDAAYLRTPPRYVLMASERDSSTATLLNDTSQWRLSGHQKLRLMHEVWSIDGGRGLFFCSVIEEIEDGSACVRYDGAIMRPTISSKNYQSAAIVDSCVSRTKQIRLPWKAGDLLIIDNWRLLHARDPYVAKTEQRELLRVLVACEASP